METKEKFIAQEQETINSCGKITKARQKINHKGYIEMEDIPIQEQINFNQTILEFLKERIDFYKDCGEKDKSKRIKEIKSEFLKTGKIVESDLNEVSYEDNFLFKEEITDWCNKKEEIYNWIIEEYEDTAIYQGW